MTDYWRCFEEAINLLLIMKPLNQRVWSHQYWSMASWISHKHQKPWNWEVTLVSSSWTVCAHRAWRTRLQPSVLCLAGAAPLYFWIKSCPPAAALPPPWDQPFPGTAQSLTWLPNLLCSVLAPLSRTPCWKEKRRNQCVIGVSDVVILG